MCAGKGTKTILMSNLLKGEGTITAYDKIKDRLGVLKSRVEELKLKNINFNFNTKNQNQFDLVLCDVPCSGIGTWRRRPENIIWLKNEELELGRSLWSNALYFHGYIDEVRIYNRALSAAEVQALYNLGQ